MIKKYIEFASWILDNFFTYVTDDGIALYIDEELNEYDSEELVELYMKANRNIHSEE